MIGQVFESVYVHPWDAPLVTLPSPAAIRDYLVGRQAPAEVAAAAARELPVPLPVTKRGALIVAKRSLHGRPPVQTTPLRRYADIQGSQYTRVDGLSV